MKTLPRSRVQTYLPIIIWIIASWFISTPLQAQEEGGQKTTGPVLHEKLEGRYVPSNRDDFDRSPAYRYSSPGFSVVQVNVDLDGMNIVGDAANEPSITFDPNDPNRMAIGWRQFDDINNSFRQAGFGFTSDGGVTWIFPGVIEPGIFRSDPVLRSDAEGNFYYNSLTLLGEDYFCHVYKSEDGGESWDEGTYALGGDKQWMTIDRTGGIGDGNIYAYWTSNWSICWPNAFTRSYDGNLSYEDCSSIPSDPYWGTALVDPDGDVLIGGSQWSGFVFTRSSSAKDQDLPVGWDFSSYVFLDGNIVGFGGTQCPNPDGLLGQTIIAMDSTGGPGDGYIYMLCSVDRSSSTDPCDVMFARSTDGGQNWDWPVRVNDDPGASTYQWFGTMSVAPDGRIDVVWLDTRDNPGFLHSALYYSYSLDQGETWSQNAKLSDSFDPHVGWPQQNKMGDYFDMYSDEAGAHLAWAATFNGEQDVYYSLIVPDYVGIADGDLSPEKKISQIYPNPTRQHAVISFELEAECAVSLKVFSLAGEEIADMVDEIRAPGIYRERFDASRLPNGIYYYRLRAGKHEETGRLAVAR